ncbi:unnamed protein product [Protopolystoma xenopodis]|uniref:Acyl-CoA dehydrogenase/oxidase N-terminal domain-containing protein n=1 Tax=Protopolystoma xenopodis TaxID=117903 RepID=A0A448XJG3_9PLAT|nr:unnamed protein product [Protopolystoma xenopodis]
MPLVDSASLDASGELPTHLHQHLAGLGLFGMQTPEFGLGLNNFETARLTEATAVDLSLHNLIATHNFHAVKASYALCCILYLLGFLLD